MRQAIPVDDFDLTATLDSGQVFGFMRAGEAFTGLLQGQEVRLRREGGVLVVEGEALPSEREVREYFDLDRDLSGVYRVLGEDAALRPALEAFRGLRLIRQDAWEALACFILSSNNNVKRIQGIWRNLARHCNPDSGAFPTARQVARCHERTLRGLGLGYRAPFLQRSALFVAANPSSLDAIREAPFEQALARVLAFPGIGPKVADCALLYGFQRYEAFPVDVWILRAVRKLYFKGRRVSAQRVRAFGMKRWGAHAGYVQQYLFHAARKGVL